MSEENTAMSGAEPEAVKEIPAQNDPVSPPGDDAKSADPSTANLPWDKDPRWKSARTAEKNLNTLLEANGFDDMKDLESSMAEGNNLRDLLGGRDAKKLLDAADTLERYEDHWAAQKLKEQEEDEDPEETIERLKKEVSVAKRETGKVQKEFDSDVTARQAIKVFDSTVKGVVKSAGMSKEESALANLVLGINNPANSVDIGNAKAVKEMAATGVENFKQLIQKISQVAVDKYVAGKSDVTPITKTGGEATPATQKKQLSKNASIDETFESARSEMMEMVLNATS